ncbi:MFS transporter [Luteolibacter luteus]|uniref:Nucleoside permease n=1 Tax=Luteolibacter luteus TaxID=2728835 RepID=A0A858RMH8_9BACT|nr:MFS transporter [Luteolibacter luteus]QJE98197.1 nucleoside permease [Luteolibacter luteus]
MSTSPIARTAPGVITFLWVAFFLWGAAPGYYTPALPNIIAAKGLGSQWLSYAFLAGPVASMISPLIMGSIADNRFAAQKVVGCIAIMSSCFLASAFAVLDTGGSPWVFILLLACSSIMHAPMQSMLASISMAHLKSGEAEFPIIRLGGTLGWMVAGFLTSFVLFADASPVAGYAAAITRCMAGCFCFFLPHTPPLGRSRSLRTLLGLDAFKLLKERDHLVFFSVTTLLSIPLAAFFMHTPMHLAALGNDKPTATMTIGQISEIAAMLLMSVVMTRFRVKTVLMFALGLSALRYALYAVGGMTGSSTWVIAGITLHGLCYTLYFITGQLFLDRRVEPEMRTQAQGLLSLVSNGIGSVTGTLLAVRLYDFTVSSHHGGWATYWWIQAGCIAICLPILAIFYQGVAASKKA